jgi:hypothetical protein
VDWYIVTDVLKEDFLDCLDGESEFLQNIGPVPEDLNVH